ncbi:MULTISPECIES: hypothetical protein [unclassified Streptomyces]|uniref:hypothetical protein n=1 Tax=unclassified Streptomyces TaxID=2593676 RepID=UPI00081EA2F5|nr:MULTISPECIES: hypothetical protein [unclassified Streptomyces]MYZ39219.1 hypothetical protein [Streptomyces sp. SID4917]SCG02764.1 hypothetical protein GA0115259_107921 [Streptomyces sp. MnatMP-M17]
MASNHSAWLTFRAPDPNPTIDVLSVELLDTPNSWTAWGPAMFHAPLPDHAAIDLSATAAADRQLQAAGWRRTSDWMEADLGYAARVEPA